MNLISIDMTLITLPGMLVTISFHCYPVIACSQNLLSHCMPTRMSPEGAFVYFMHQQVSLVFVYTSDQNHVKVSFVQNVPVQEEVAR